MSWIDLLWSNRFLFNFIKNVQQVRIDIRARTNHDGIPMEAFCPGRWYNLVLPSSVYHVTKISPTKNRREQGQKKILHVAACYVRILGVTPNQTCVKLYRSSRLSLEGVAEKWMRSWARVFPGYSRVRIPRCATRMPESAVARSRMQLRAFNEVSRLAADPTQRGVTRCAGARVSFSFGIHYPFDLSPSWPSALTHLPICPPRGTGIFAGARTLPELAKNDDRHARIEKTSTARGQRYREASRIFDKSLLTDLV